MERASAQMEADLGDNQLLALTAERRFDGPVCGGRKAHSRFCFKSATNLSRTVYPSWDRRKLVTRNLPHVGRASEPHSI